MAKVSSWQHIIRLLAILVLFVVGVLIVKKWATPEDWNYVVWYRQGALDDLAEKEPLFGGNESCVECHQDVVDEAVASSHQNLFCETCHGPLSLHVTDGEKVADASVMSELETRTQCLRCHLKIIGKPETYPQFIAEKEQRKIRRHRLKVKEDTSCLDCHYPHDPVIL